jgi:hypothetical protein
MSQEVTAYIQNLKQPWQVEVCNRIRQVIHQSIPDVVERIQYGKPHYLQNGKYACVLSATKAGVNFTIFNATTLTAPEGVFEPGGSPDRKTIKIRDGQDVDYELLATLVHQAAHL